MLKSLTFASFISFSLGFELQHVLSNDKYSCPKNLPLSCSNKTEVSDSCCFEFPGGIMLQTQFWDYIPPTGVNSPEDIIKLMGPLDSFTNHGLWPDNCDGSYAQFCDSNLNIDDVWHLLNEEQFNNNNRSINGSALLKSMSTFWKSNTGSDESLWVHEYNKHGTCIHTLAPKCYEKWGIPGDARKQAIYDYFRIAMQLFHDKDTYHILKEGGIEPSNETTYNRDQISKALSKGHSEHEVHFLCDRYGALNQVWYYHSLQGSILSENFVPIHPFSKTTNCPENNIKWYPKGHVPSGFKPPGGTNPGVRGVIRLGNQRGFLIKNGHWYNKGTPAQYFLIEAPFGNYYLKSRMGYCGLNGEDGPLACNKNIAQAAQFEYENKRGYIGYAGKFDWHATKFPSGNSQSPVYAGKSEDGYEFQLKFVKS